MTSSNLNAFEAHEVSISMNTVKLAVLIVGVVKFLLVQILLHRKRILSLFTAFQSPIFEEKRDDRTKGEEEEEEVEERSLCGGEVVVVLRRLGFCCEEKIPARVKVLEVFEEREASLDEVREAFDVFDENRDGFIDERELQRVLCCLGFDEGVEVESCRRMVGRFDEDGDGRIDFDEFVKFMENRFD